MRLTKGDVVVLRSDKEYTDKHMAMSIVGKTKVIVNDGMKIPIEDAPNEIIMQYLIQDMKDYKNKLSTAYRTYVISEEDVQKVLYNIEEQ